MKFFKSSEKEDSWFKSIYKSFPLIIKSIIEKDLFSQSAALSYYCALSLAPFIIITITAFSFIGSATEDAFAKQITDTVGGNAAEAILLIIKTAKENKESRGISGILALITLLISASAVFSQLKTTIVAIFNDKNACEVEVPEQSWGDFFKEKVFSIGMMVSFIFISLVSLMLSSALPFILSTESGLFWQVVNFLISFGVYATVFFLVFYFVSNRSVKKVDAWIGGTIAALLFVIGRSLISVYISESAVGSSYGAAGSLIVLLVWVYYSSFIVFTSGIIAKNIINIKKIKHGASVKKIEKEVLDDPDKK